MSEPLATSISRSASKLVALGEQRGTGAALDYSRASLTIVEQMAAEAIQWRATLSADQFRNLAQNMGCYLLEVGRHEFGGQYLWHEPRHQPVLVVGEPSFHLAFMRAIRLLRRTDEAGRPKGGLLILSAGGWIGRCPLRRNLACDRQRWLASKGE